MMTPTTTSRSAAWVALLVFGSLLAGMTPAPPTAAAPAVDPQNNPTVSVAPGGTQTARLDLAALTAWTGGLSSLFPNQISAGYTVAVSDLVGNNATLFYTTDGTMPAKATAKTVELVSDSLPADETRLYEGEIPAADLAGGRTVIFMIELKAAGPSGTGVGCDVGVNRAGGARFTAAPCPNTLPATAGFRYNLDGSRPNATSTVLVDTFSTINGKVVTNEVDAGLALLVTDGNVTDNATYSSTLDPLSVKVTFKDGTTTVLEYNARSPGPGSDRFHAVANDYNLTVTLERGAFDWPLNRNITTTFVANDRAGNPLTEGAGPTFHIDRRNPVVRALTAASISPVIVEEGVNRTGVGATVRVRAEVEEEYIDVDPDNRSAVRVHLFSETGGFRSDVVGLAYRQTSGGRKVFEGDVPIFNSTRNPTATFRIRMHADVLDLWGNQAGFNSPELNVEVVPGAPIVSVEPITPPIEGLVGKGPYLVRGHATDADRGIDDELVKLRIQALTGRFASTSGWTRVGTGPDAFEKKMNKDSPGNYSVEIPDATDGTLFTYQVRAQDKLGNLNFSALLSLTADRRGPIVEEVGPKEFRGGGNPTFAFNATDTPTDSGGLSAGVDPATARLFIRRQGTGTYRELPLEATGDRFTATATTEFTGGTLGHGDVLEYYAEVEDRLGNVGTAGTSSRPSRSKIDMQPPTVVPFAPPPEDDDGRFTLTAHPEDPDSGPDRVIFEIRARSASPGAWALLQNSTLESASVCLPGGTTYEFRASATDRAGNRGAPVAFPGATRVLGEGCPQTVAVTVLYPSSGAVIDAMGGAATVTLRYDAAPTGSLEARQLVLIGLEFSPDEGRHYVVIARNQPNTGTYDWVAAAPACERCLLRVTGTLPNGNTTSAVSAPFQILNGSPQTDLDNNGVNDQCELTWFGTMGTDPDADPDSDGLNNAKECARIQDLRSLNPALSDTDHDGASDGSEERAGTDPFDPQSIPSKTDLRFEQFELYWWILPGLFLLILVTFLFGLTRRW